MIVAEGFGNTAQACRALNLGRSTYYLTSQKSEVSHLLEQEIRSKSKDHPRYGYRRITGVVRRDGYSVNAKLTQRVRRIEGLQVKKKQRKMRRLGESATCEKGWKSGSDATTIGGLTRHSATRHQVRFTTIEVVENPEKKRHEKRKVTGRDWTSTFQQQHSTSLRSVPYCGLHYDVQRRNDRGQNLDLQKLIN